MIETISSQYQCWRIQYELKSYLLGMLIIGLSVVSNTTFAQNSTNTPPTTVILKNGKTVEGYLKELIPNERVKIEGADGSLFILEWAEIEKVSRSPQAFTASDNQPELSPKAKGRNGFYVGAQAGPTFSAISLESLEHEGLGYSAALIAQYFFSKHWGVLTGFGVSSYGNGYMRGTYASFPIIMRYVTGQAGNTGLCLDLGTRFSLRAGTSYLDTSLPPEWVEERFNTFTTAVLLGIGAYRELTPELSVTASLNTDMSWLRFTRSGYDLNAVGLQVGVFYKFKNDN